MQQVVNEIGQFISSLILTVFIAVPLAFVSVLLNIYFIWRYWL